MSDEAATHFEAQAPPEVIQATGGRSVTLTVTLHPNGQIEFSLPTNKVLAHGLLGVAQEQLAKIDILAELKQAQSARGGLDWLVKRVNGGKH